MNHKFAVFYASVISVALVGSLCTSYLNPVWHHIVFTFPPETQKVIVNGTAFMDISWRWLPDTLEMIVKVNDDDFYHYPYGEVSTDFLGLLFDSDQSGNLTTNIQVGPPPDYGGNDYGVFVFASNASGILEHCFYNLPGPYWGANVVMWIGYWGSPFIPLITNMSNTYCIFDKDEGYTFYLSIPREIIKVSPTTPIHISFMDYEAIVYGHIHHEYAYQEVIAADFEG